MNLESKTNLNKDISPFLKVQNGKKTESIVHHIKQRRVPNIPNSHATSTDSIMSDVVNTDCVNKDTSKNSINSNNTQNVLQDTTAIPTHLTIQVESRKFCLSLEKLDSICRQKIVSIFAQKQYTLEELLTLFVTTLRDQSAAEQELMRIVQALES